MKVCLIERPGVCGFADRPVPELQPGEVLLQIKRIGFCGSDLNTYRGLNPLVSYPRIPGHEVAAVVVDKAGGVPDSIPLGATVTVVPYTNCGQCAACRANRPHACQSNQTLGVQRDGALAEFLAVPWQKIVHSSTLTLEQHALVEPLSVGFHAIERGRVARGDTVVVLGSGMIGLGAIAGAAMQRQARVIAVDIDDRKLALARQAGATDTVNSRTESLSQRLRPLTDGHGPSVIIEAVGAPETYLAAIQEVCFAGRVVYIGYVKQPVTYETKNFVMKELDILGSRNATRENFEQVIQVLESGRYPVRETITRTAPFAQAGEALRDWSEHPTEFTKIHITLA